MSRLGAQRIGMEGMEEEVAARVEKGMAPMARKPGGRLKSKAAKEATTAQQLAGLCRKAIAVRQNMYIEADPVFSCENTVDFVHRRPLTFSPRPPRDK